MGVKHAGTDFVHITPYPAFTRLDRAYERVLRRMEMPGGVFILRRVAASYMPAYKTHAQMNPSISCLDAILTFVSRRLRNPHLVEVAALCCHMSPPDQVNT